MKKPALFRKILFFLPVLLFLARYGVAQQISGSSGTLSLAPSAATLVDPSITVSGSSNLADATVQISGNYYSGDILSFDASVASSYGVTGSYITTAVSGILNFTGTTSPAGWQAIFRTVKYQNTTAACGPSGRTITFMQGRYLFNSFNGHFYEYVGENLNWKDAKTAAESRSYNGMQGYLATATSIAENNFIWKLMSADAWVGASYDYEEINAATGTTTFNDQSSAISKVYWVTGPEKGTPVSTGLANPVAQNGAFMNWAGGEPNNFGNEYYIELYSGNQGKWNDLSINASLPYLVEYGGLPTDNPQNNSFNRSLQLTSTVGGDISGGDISVCAGSNSVTLTTTAAVSGVSILRWESSYDNFLTAGTVINNTTSTLTVNNLTQTTFYRSIASGNSCSAAPSSSTKIIAGSSGAGNLAAVHTNLCNGAAAELSISGYNGDILKWQSSTDNNTWTDIANTTALYTSAPLSPGTYYYRAEIKNAACPSSVLTSTATITVSSASASIGGTVSGATNACGPGNTGLLTVTGYTGAVVKWQSSTNGGITWSDIVNTDDTYTFNDISTTTKYRAVIQNGSCDFAYSSPLIVSYSPLSNSWNGSADTDFGNAANWSCSVPGPGTNIVIDASAPQMPLLDQDRAIGNISFGNNTSIAINGHTLTLKGAVSGPATGLIKGSSASSLTIAGNGNGGTIYFDQSIPGTTDLINALNINIKPAVVPTPLSPVCSPYNYGGYNGSGITNVTFGSINNSTPTYDDAYHDYTGADSTLVSPSTDYNLSVTMPYDWGDQGIKVWIDWNNNGIFGDEPAETIVSFDGGYPGTYNFTVSVPAIGGDITGGSKTMRVMVDDYYSMMYDGLDACNGEYGEMEDYKINLAPLPTLPGTVTLGSNLTVSGILNFTKGIVNTGTNILIFAAGSTAMGAKDSSHVNGNVRKTGNTAFTFPVGDDAFYAPVSISAPSDINDHFTASYHHTNPLSVYNNPNFLNNIIGISNNEYWMLERTAGSSNVALTLGWDGSRSSALSSLLTVRVVHWDGFSWTDAGNSGTMTGDLTAGTVTSKTVSSFSPFTIGTSSILLPVTLVNFTAIKQNRQVILSWKTSLEVNSDRFEVERSTNGTAWMKIGEVKAKGNTTTAALYTFNDDKPVDGNNYYRLKQVDDDGRFVYSPVRIVNFSSGTDVAVYPNPFTRMVTVDAGNKPVGDIMIADISGKIVYRSRIEGTKQTIDLSILPAGEYTLVQSAGSFKILKAR